MQQNIKKQPNHNKNLAFRLDVGLIWMILFSVVDND